MNKNFILVLCFLLAGTFLISAQEFDDIYYNSSKNKKKESTKKQTKHNTVIEEEIFIANETDFECDGLALDVDEYNRRYSSQQVEDTIGEDNQSNFVYTDRIRRFYNPTVIEESGDKDLAEAYYVLNSPNVNIYVESPYSYWDTYWYGWNYPSYMWDYCWYGYPYYPYSYGYYPWGYDWYWHNNFYHHPWRPIHYPSFYPIAPPKPSVTHRPTHDNGGRRPFGNVGTGSNNPGGRRPNVSTGNIGNTSVNNANKGRRPSVNNSSTTTNNRGNNTSSNVNSSNSGRRPSVNKDQGTNNSYNKSNSGSYNNRSSQPSRNSGGFSSGGSRGGFGGSASGGRTSNGGSSRRR